MLRIALTHDIDRTQKTYQFVTKPLMAVKKGNLNDFTSSLRTLFRKGNYWNFEDIISIENSFNVKSTFFFLNESIAFNPIKPGTFKLALGRYKIDNPEIIKLIRWLDANGWEIGVHGSYRSYNQLSLLSEEKRTLEQIVGREIVGIRQHYLNLDESTWDIQRELGFKYDSSFGLNRSIGFKDDKILPFRPFKDEFVVIPQTLMDTPYMNTKSRDTKLESIMDICEEKGGILVVNFHNDKFNIYDFPGYRDAYIGIIESGLRRGAHFDTLKGFWESLKDTKES